MSKRGDNIHKRKDGRWEGRYKKGRKPDGRIIYGSIYAQSYREAKDKLLHVQNDTLITQAPKHKGVTFSDVLDQWMQNNAIRLKGGTLHKYQSIIDIHIKKELGNINITDINAVMVNSFLTQKLNSGRKDNTGGLSPSYVRSMMLIINATLKYAVQEELCMPLRSPILKPAKVKNDLHILSSHDQKILESHLLTTEMLPHNIGIYISLHSGLRIGELCALRWKDIDFEKRIMSVRHTISRVKNSDNATAKTKMILDTPKTITSKRDIPIVSSLFPILTKLKATSVSDYVISCTSNFVNPRTMEYHFRRILDFLNIEPINFHALRHTFATRCIEAGVDVKSLSEILGHSNVSITLNTYVHSSMDLKRAQLEKTTTIIL